MSAKKNLSNNLSPKLLSATKLALVVLVISVTGLFLYFFQPNWFRFDFNKPVVDSAPVVDEATTTIEVCPDCVGRLLDGVMVPPELAKLQPYAVMIDNFPSARPQFGLSKASLVYEAPAEGGITRYLAVFSPDLAPAEIGPVRSARSYFLNWAKELEAVYVHVGGSPEALNLAKNIGKNNLDEVSKGSYFWRSSDRSAPHNVLISGDKLKEYNNLATTKITAWQFKEAATSTISGNSELKIKYSPGYNVAWQYQSDTNTYLRSLDNEAHVDADGSNIIAKNIIIHLTSFKVTDDKLRLEMSTAITGKALLCQDGECQLGSWKKNSLSSRAKYYDKSGAEFVFNVGNTWIEVTDSLQNVQY